MPPFVPLSLRVFVLKNFSEFCGFRHVPLPEIERTFAFFSLYTLDFSFLGESMSLLNILVIGGAGFIGSHVCNMLSQEGFRPIIFDNLSTGKIEAVEQHTFIQGDLANPQDLDHVFEAYPITAVMHFAAVISVGESTVDPLKYYTQNVAYTLNLLQAMRKHQVKTLIFSSSAAIFGNPIAIPVSENHPCMPINPYGQTKLMIEKILDDCDRAYGIKSTCLRYFNAAGGDPKGKIKNYQQNETNLIPIVLGGLKHSKPVTIFGTDYPTPDGTCIRDFIHVEDLGAAHILALKKLLQGGKSSNYNLGNGNGFSVREVIAAVEEQTGVKVNVIEGSRRPGDPPVLIADSTKARNELGWEPLYPNLKEMISHALQAQVN
jgi:UDP-glucose 4-epimerase